MEFYSVKKKAKVEVADSKCQKTIYPHQTSKGVQERYAVRAQDDDGTKLTKFIKKEDFDKLKCKVVKP